MTRQTEAWAVVLAGGEGRRVRALTVRDGEQVPKQYCRLWGGRSMLAAALERASAIVRRDRVVTVVLRGHRRWWEDELLDLPPENVVVQPGNRGTAIGLLLPLLRILQQDPAAVVAVLPSDHYFATETVIHGALAIALRQAALRPRRIVLLGVVPEPPAAGLGWIVPASAAAMLEPVAVREFREKPPPATRSELMARGAVANTLLLAAHGGLLLELYRRFLPDLTAELESAVAAGVDRRDLDRLFDELPVADFSRKLLEPAASWLVLLRVPPCGWTDMGTPERVARRLARLRHDARPVVRGRAGRAIRGQETENSAGATPSGGPAAARKALAPQGLLERSAP